MTKQERERLQELLAKATPGPWEVRRQWSNGCERGPLIYGLKKWVAEVVGAPYIVGSEPTMSNAALITEAVNALTALLSDSEERDALRSRLEQLVAGVAKADAAVCQTLGKALGYPWYKDDQKNFPGATEDNGVCVGEHVPETLAMEAARRLEQCVAALRQVRAAVDAALEGK